MANQLTIPFKICTLTSNEFTTQYVIVISIDAFIIKYRADTHSCDNNTLS